MSFTSFLILASPCLPLVLTASRRLFPALSSNPCVARTFPSISTPFDLSRPPPLSRLPHLRSPPSGSSPYSATVSVSSPRRRLLLPSLPLATIVIDSSSLHSPSTQRPSMPDPLVFLALSLVRVTTRPLYRHPNTFPFFDSFFVLRFRLFVADSSLFVSD